MLHIISRLTYRLMLNAGPIPSFVPTYLPSFLLSCSGTRLRQVMLQGGGRHVCKNQRLGTNFFPRTNTGSALGAMYGTVAWRVGIGGWDLGGVSFTLRASEDRDSRLGWLIVVGWVIFRERDGYSKVWSSHHLSCVINQVRWESLQT